MVFFCDHSTVTVHSKGRFEVLRKPVDISFLTTLYIFWETTVEFLLKLILVWTLEVYATGCCFTIQSVVSFH